MPSSIDQSRVGLHFPLVFDGVRAFAVVTIRASSCARRAWRWLVEWPSRIPRDGNIFDCESRWHVVLSGVGLRLLIKSVKIEVGGSHTVGCWRVPSNVQRLR